MRNLLSTATVATIGLTCKAFLNLGLCELTVNNHHILLDALKDEEKRKEGTGIVTVSNHISTLDDPVTWGIMPTQTYLSPRLTRWSLGAHDIMFTNPVFSTFFRNGQVLETFRGRGVYQPSVDTAISKLSQGDWVHLFGEGRVCQPKTYIVENGRAKLRRFKWGIGRIIMETPRPPMIIPMWITGFDKLMPEGRPAPFNFIPRIPPFAAPVPISITFGTPINPEDITNALRGPHSPATMFLSQSQAQSQRQSQPQHSPTAASSDIDGGPSYSQSWVVSQVQADSLSLDLGGEEERRRGVIRKRVTEVVQDAVERLGREVSGELLGREMERGGGGR
ncbi:acyltransferase-domain-containing protein [Stereum hirsutum FP-91666 SS1]|uniref:acyltransferase-domain-containing protein n=1 Tax=Stereum hirsutum (strain FP-91666) TaxID=721885 RepID=UPI0004449E8D|nr:acyltransferase-domain-containing protein [Stereum hirsutum FP-91666 SS1]EIM84944.1 acyltransferase-domain-containing protein [Stereum hirsutum FP-91666 SS1]